MNVLVVVAHSDDEVLGCGGTIARHVAKGDGVNLALLSDGVTSRNEATDEAVAARSAMQKNAQRILGIKQVFEYSFPDNQMDTVPLLRIVKTIEKVIDQTKAEVLYTHYHGDLNIDHKIVHKAVMTACRPLPDSSVCEIYGFEVLSSTEWQVDKDSVFFPQKFVNIEHYYQVKKDALVAYQKEMRVRPHSRCFEHVECLAKHRGLSVGLNMAEAFAIYRTIDR